MKLRQISIMALILALVVVTGCKAAQPETAYADASEQVVDNGLQELEEIDSLAEETDLGLEEIEKMELE